MVVKSSFRALRERAAFDGQCPGVTDGYPVDLLELLELDLHLIIDHYLLETGRWPS